MSTISDAEDGAVGAITATARAQADRLVAAVTMEIKAEDQAQITAALATATNYQNLLVAADAKIDALQAQIAAMRPAFPAGWSTAIFEDYFDGTALDATKWTVLDQVGHKNEVSWLQAANVTVDGVCHIVGKREAAGGRAFTSGYMSTEGKFALPTDRPWAFETRLRLPLVDGKSSGLWPAHWFRNSPGVGELDSIESYGTPGNPKSALVADNAEVTVWQNTSGGAVYKIGKIITPMAWADWHVIRTEGDPTTGTYAVYVDGVLKQSVNPSSDSWIATNGKLPHKPASWLHDGTSFAQPLYPIFNLQIGGTYGGQPDAATVFPADFQIDYARAFTK